MQTANTSHVSWQQKEPGDLRAYIVALDGTEREAGWCPQPGSQEQFLAATPIFEVLYEGNRGNGKTDSLLFDFAQHVGKGYGAEWRGILFRQTYPQLVDVITKSIKWFKRVCPDAVFNRSTSTWVFPHGERLLFRQMRTPDDYWNYHGHSYPWIGFEELTSWATPDCYTIMQSCCRSSHPNIPRCYRATTNSYGSGFAWVKRRFQLPQMRGKIIREEGVPLRLAINGMLSENKILLAADPDYVEKIKAAASSPAQLEAWLNGSWDINAGGMFDDLWRAESHIVPSVPLSAIPARWKLDRSFDWGSSAPFSVCWWAESNGEPFNHNGHIYGRVRGDLYLVHEWYGFTGKRNEGLRMLAKDVARGILSREESWGAKGKVVPGAADSAIYTVENGKSIADDFLSEGVRWVPVDKSPGSRVHGWEQLRKMLKGAIDSPREAPGMFFMDNCVQAIETLPTLPRDKQRIDDVCTHTEDHIADAVRYRVWRKPEKVTKQGTF